MMPMTRCSARARRVTLLLLGVVVLSLGDLLLTVECMTTMGMMEANPIAVYLARSTGSAWALSAYKMLTVAVSVGLLYRLRHHRSAEVAAWCAATVLAVLTLSWSAYAGCLDESDLYALRSTDATSGWVILN
jgi:uncharacterized membrane protein